MADAETPATSQAAAEWPWWWSQDQERYNGPHESRTEAILNAFAEDVTGSIHVMQATHAEISCDLYDAADLADQFDELNAGAADPESAPPSAEIPTASWEALARLIEARVRRIVRERGVLPWAFSGQTPGEWIDLSSPRLSALPVEARHLLEEIAIGFDPEQGFADSYIDEQVRRLKRLVRPAEPQVSR